ncbi:MAG: translation initiation factor IF-3 [Proteobacteria bacterium]|jgi:translation initiation factor IF-3|nr:translation initiation factor IF-3 [Pseudomonadota bacterium]
MQKDQQKFCRVNRQIRFSPVMVILGEEKLGTMPTSQALEIAVREGLDLVEVAPNARPPVCKIMDYGKFRYEQSIKEKKSKSQTKAQQLKEIRLRPSIATHDLDVKINSAQRFLEAGNRVQLMVRFKGAENAHKDLGFSLMQKMIDSLVSCGKPLSTPRLEGKGVSCIIEPMKK